MYLNPKSKGPEYDKNEDANKQSPNNFVIFYPRVAVSSVHLWFSLPNPVINFVAAFNFLIIISASAVKSSNLFYLTVLTASNSANSEFNLESSYSVASNYNWFYF